MAVLLPGLAVLAVWRLWGSSPRGSGMARVLVFGGGAIVLGVVLVVLVAIGTTIFAGKKYQISTPDSAGGMPRDPGVEDPLTSAASPFWSSLDSNDQVSDYARAAYADDSTAYLFLGGAGKVDDQDGFLRAFRSAAARFSRSDSVSEEKVDGGGDGKAACVTVRGTATGSSTPYSTAICAWVTKTSFGEIIPFPLSNSTTTVPVGKTASELALIMRRMRSDIETGQ